ncbi:DUF2299 domain-containing protein [Metallosphaera hakonensis]|uniref:DUF2299 domain-containing protein n=1 Tax=Metallosphaera hakonensis JCM 8857 = DSM 7519 TaxID=1293036 RepID=A0A2U9IW19_9CREN|nr:DUF2299 domain-containing protein [Metallosphaera hakonensis]AWS00272.1 DUF2299 domain-containing protein [Metallosphaera hakonensis JCM 8857 = DSM 7519]
MENKIKEWLTNLGMKVWTPDGAKEYFHVSVAPPQGAPVVDVIKPTNMTNFYIVGMGIAVHQSHQDMLRKMSTSSRKAFIDEIKYFLIEMELDVAFLPAGQEIPQLINVSKVVYQDGLKANRFLDVYYTVRNGGTYVIMRFLDSFGSTGQSAPDTKYG